MDAACDRCLPQRRGQLSGTAACRGTAWAERTAGRTQRRDPWPAHERAAELARRQVRDLTRDPRLLELLAAECSRAAARRWEEIRLGLPRWSAEPR